MVVLDFFVFVEGVCNIKSMWEKGNVFLFFIVVGILNKEIVGLKVGVFSCINEWLIKILDGNKLFVFKFFDLRLGDVFSKWNFWEK